METKGVLAYVWWILDFDRILGKWVNPKFADYANYPQPARCVMKQRIAVAAVMPQWSTIAVPVIIQ